MRAFLAVELSDAIRDSLREFMAPLQRLDVPVKWTRPENLHLTLKFLGDVPEENVPAVIEIATSASHGLAETALTIEGAGAFPNLKRPRVLFVKGADDPPVLEELARRLNRNLTRAGVPKEERGFKVHVTLGRARRPRPAPELAHRLARDGEQCFGTMRVDHFTLMQSELTAAGPIYTPVAKVELNTA